MHRGGWSLVVVALLAAACSRKDDDRADGDVASPATSSAARIGSCDRVASMSFCAEYTGSYLAQNELALTGNCKRFSGAFVYAACPNTAVLGACTLPTGEVRKLYASGEAAFDAERAKKECETGYHGSWKEHR